MGAVMLAAAPALPCVGPTAIACSKAKDVVGDTVSGVADSFMERLVQSTMEGLVEIVGTFGTSMFIVDSPNVGTEDGQASSTLSAVSSSLEWVVLLVGMLAMMAAVVRMFWTLDAGTEGRVIVRMMINVVASSSLVIGITALLLRASDEFSLWALYAISGHREEDLNTGDKFAQALLAGGATTDYQMMHGLSLIAIILIIVAAAGSIMQFLWMIVRSPLIIATVAFIPVFAASSGFRTGQERFNKALMFLLACVLYKPVAAILYGLGLRMMQAQGDDANPLQEFMWGTTLLLLVGLAGPAMVKFFVAEAAVGTSNAFSGAAGIAAAGAAVYGAAALGATFATGGTAAGAAGGGAAVGTAPLSGGGPPPSAGGTGAQQLASASSGMKQLPPGNRDSDNDEDDDKGGSGGGPPPPPPPPPGGGGAPEATAAPGDTGGSAESPAAAASVASPVGSSQSPTGQAAPSSGGTPSAAPTGDQSMTGAPSGDGAGYGAPAAPSAPLGSGGARLAGSRARQSAERAGQAGLATVSATGAAIDEMSESAEAGSARRG